MKLLARPTPVAAHASRTRCARCGSGFRAELTRWACPVCGWEADRPAVVGLSRWLDDPGNRIVALVAGSTVANALLLLVLAVAVSRSG